MEEEVKDRLMENITHPELRLGYVTELYYSVTGGTAPKQLDLLNTWFPSLIIQERKSEGIVKEAPEFVDHEHLIYATRYHNYLYNGGNNRVTQIAGKLVGTASSNKEKERKAAELIQKHLSRRLVSEMDPLPDLIENTDKMLEVLNEEMSEQFHFVLYMFCLRCADTRYEKDQYERDSELFAFDDEVFDQIIYNAFYQLCRFEYEGTVYAFLWLLLGSLLRNECGRICRTYDSSFVPIHKAASETGHLLDKLHYLMDPEAYESFYAGDDLEKRFPGIEWYCDGCGDHLNQQDGFTDYLPVWQCRKCGYLNPIESDEIYDNEEDAQNHIRRKKKGDIEQAIKARKKEKNQSDSES